MEAAASYLSFVGAVFRRANVAANRAFLAVGSVSVIHPFVGAVFRFLVTADGAGAGMRAVAVVHKGKGTVFRLRIAAKCAGMAMRAVALRLPIAVNAGIYVPETAADRVHLQMCTDAGNLIHIVTGLLFLADMAAVITDARVGEVVVLNPFATVVMVLYFLMTADRAFMEVLAVVQIDPVAVGTVACCDDTAAQGAFMTVSAVSVVHPCVEAVFRYLMAADPAGAGMCAVFVIHKGVGAVFRYLMAADMAGAGMCAVAVIRKVVGAACRFLVAADGAGTGVGEGVASVIFPFAKGTVFGFTAMSAVYAFAAVSTVAVARPVTVGAGCGFHMTAAEADAGVSAIAIVMPRAVEVNRAISIARCTA